MAISIEFQKRLNELVEETEIKKSDLPDLIGIGRSTFFKTVNYGIIPMTSVLIKIADYFKISIEYLLARTDNMDFSPTQNPSTFLERLDELKDTKNLTYYGVGKQIFLGSNYFAAWKKGFIPSLDYLIMLAEFFDTTIDYLIGRTDDR